MARYSDTSNSDIHQYLDTLASNSNLDLGNNGNAILKFEEGNYQLVIEYESFYPIEKKYYIITNGNRRLHRDSYLPCIEKYSNMIGLEENVVEHIPYYREYKTNGEFYSNERELKVNIQNDVNMIYNIKNIVGIEPEDKPYQEFNRYGNFWELLYKFKNAVVLIDKEKCEVKMLGMKKDWYIFYYDNTNGNINSYNGAAIQIFDQDRNISCTFVRHGKLKGYGDRESYTKYDENNNPTKVKGSWTDFEYSD